MAPESEAAKRIDAAVGEWRQGDVALGEHAFIDLVVRRCTERPFVEVAPLVAVPEEVLADVERARRPALAWVPRVAGRGLVADLDRTMTIEKSVLVGATRAGGLRDRSGGARLRAGARAKARALRLPGGLHPAGSQAPGSDSRQDGRRSDEGSALRALREICVRAAPPEPASLGFTTRARRLAQSSREC
jgi:hypothetical protein